MEKDQIINLLVVAVGLFITIITSIKKKKANAAAQQQRSTVEMNTHDDTKYQPDADFRSPEVLESYPAADLGPWSYDSQVVDEQTRQMPVDMKTELAMNKLGRDIKSNKHKQNTEAIKDAEIGAPEGERTGILANFNLRDAVIYSELLKPKFEE